MKRQTVPTTPPPQSCCTEGSLLSTAAKILTQHMTLMTEVCLTRLPSPSSLFPCSAHWLPRGKRLREACPGRAATCWSHWALPADGLSGMGTWCPGSEPWGATFRAPRRTLSSVWKKAESPVTPVSLWASPGNNSRGLVAFWGP